MTTTSPSTPDATTAASASALGTTRAEVAAPFAAAIRAHLRESWPQQIGLDTTGSTELGWVSTADWFTGRHGTHLALLAIADGIQGPVLDVGAGCGRATKVLRERGLDVVALDCEPACIEAMRHVGIADAVHADIRDWRTERRFRTILLLDSTLGLIGTPEHLPVFMARLDELLEPDGVILIQGAIGPYAVQPWETRFVYRDLVGERFQWVNYRFDGLAEAVAPLGWHAKLRAEMWGCYVAELRRGKPPLRWPGRIAYAVMWLAVLAWLIWLVDRR